MASGQTLVTFVAQQAIPAVSSSATQDTRNNHPVVDFDASTEESISFESILPRNYGGGGITAAVVWMASSATANGVAWGVSFERHQDDTDDLDADGFASEQIASETTSTLSGEPKYTDVASTNGAQIDSLAVGEHFRFKLARKVADAGDTMTGDAEVLAVELRET
jgi:hypothetical protein